MRPKQFDGNGNVTSHSIGSNTGKPSRIIASRMSSSKKSEKVIEWREFFQFRETQRLYIDHFGVKKCEIDTKNTCLWELN